MAQATKAQSFQVAVSDLPKDSISVNTVVTKSGNQITVTANSTVSAAAATQDLRDFLNGLIAAL